MKIGINASILGGRLTGVGNYLLELIRGSAALEGNQSHEFFIFGAPDTSCLPPAPNFRLVTAHGLRGWRRIVWEQVELPKLCRQYKVDVLHCPDFARPFHVSVPVVNTIHDLSFYSNVSFFPFFKRMYKRALCRVAMAKSSVLIADSEFTKKEIVERFGSNRNRVLVALLGGPQEKVKRRARSDSPFVLFVGTLEKRKNVAALVDAYVTVRSAGLPHRLVLVGQRGYGWNHIASAIERNPFKSDIEVLGYVEPAVLDALYNSADLFVFPSLYEGFGLPVLEAMSRGCPVLCSRSASLPEVGGDAVEYSNIETPQALGADMIRTLSSEQRPSELTELGWNQLTKFSWRKCAEVHLHAFQTAASMCDVSLAASPTLTEQTSIES